MKNDVFAQIKRGGVPKVPYKQVYDVLQVSYDELPLHLKHCFLYLASFPEDYEIPTEKLFHLWVGEGIVLKEDLNELEEDVAGRYLNELVLRNMVQVAYRASGTGRIASCRLHDLMRDICIDIANREGFFQIINCQSYLLTHHKNAEHLLTTWLPNRDKKIRRLAVCVSDQEPHSTSLSATTVLASVKVSRAPNLRSLLLFSVNKKRGEGNCKNFAETISSHFPLLRVLSCEDFPVKGKLPTEIGNLVHLRYLCLINSLVDELPSSIQKLQWLQTLDLRLEINTVLSIPNVLWKMKQLRHLYLPYYGGLGMAETERIRDAPQRYVIKGGGKLRLDGLRNLQTLIFIDLDRVDLQGLSNLERMDVVTAMCESNKEALYSFLQCSSMKSFMLRVHAQIINEDPLILSSCVAIHHLDIHAQQYADFHLIQPFCIEMLPKSLVRFDIWYLELVDDPLPVLEKLPNLSILGLHMCYRGTKMVCSSGGFPELVRMSFDHLSEFCEWEVEEGALQKLKTLLIINCRVKMIPDTLPSSVIVRTC